MNLNIRIRHAALFAVVVYFSSWPTLEAATVSYQGPPTHPGTEPPRKVTLDLPEVVVPMSIHSRIPVVAVMINGRGPFDFFLDTGAGATVINDDLAKELHLPVVGSVKIGDPADPQGITAATVSVDVLQISGASFANFTAVSWDRSTIRPDGPRGILGIPLFSELLLTLDYPGAKLVLGRGELPVANGGDIVNYRNGEASLFSVPLLIAGVSMEATLDSGGGGKGLGFPTEYIDKLPLVSKPVEVGRGRMAGGEVVILGATLNGSVKIGGREFDHPVVHFNARLRHINLGSDLLSNFAVTIDRKNQRIRFKQQQATGAPANKSSPSGS